MLASPKHRRSPVGTVCLLLSLVSFTLQAQSPVSEENNAAGPVDEDILQKAPSMSAEELKQLLTLYTRKHDPTMAIKIRDLLVKANPDDEETKNLILPSPVVVSKETAVPLPHEVVEARRLVAAGKAQEAVAMLEKLPATLQKEYALDCASALDEAGLNARAIQSYEDVLAKNTCSEEDHQDIQQRLDALRCSEKLVKINRAIEAGKQAEAARLFQELSAAETVTPEARIIGARLQILSGEIAAGEAALRKLASETTLATDLREDARSALEDSQITRLLREGEAATEDGDPQLALRISQELYTLAPLRTEVAYFRAKALLNHHEPEAALKILEAKPPAIGDENAKDHDQLLAQALEHTGAWKRAVACYRKLGEDATLPTLERCDYLQSADTLASLGSAGISGQWMLSSTEEGDWSAFHVAGQTGDLGHGVQFLVEGYEDRLSPKLGRWSDHAQNDQVEATASLRAHFNSQQFIQGWITEHDDGEGAGVALGRMPVAGPGYQLRYDYQRRAADSLFLRSLNGRQNRVSGSLEADLGKEVSLDVQAFWREVTVDGTSLGHGAGVELSLSKTLLDETADHPSLTVSYLGEFSRFESRSNASVMRAVGLEALADPQRLSELVDPDIHRHELQLSLHRSWNTALETTLLGAVGYEFDDAKGVWRVGLQAAYRLRSNLRLTLQADYDSSAKTANANSAVETFSLGLTLDF